MRWCPRPAPACERLDDDHAATAAWASRVGWFVGLVVIGWRHNRDREQGTGEREACLAGAAGEQAVVADAVEPLRQDVEQEAADARAASG